MPRSATTHSPTLQVHGKFEFNVTVPILDTHMSLCWKWRSLPLQTPILRRVLFAYDLTFSALLFDKVLTLDL